MQPVFVVGVGMTAFGRLLDLDIKSLAHAASDAALADAQISLSAIEAVFFANSAQGHMDGQHMIRGQLAMRAMGLGGVPVVNVENACAGGSTALAMAASRLRAGEAEVAMAIGAEKLFSRDRARMLTAFDSGWDVSSPQSNRDRLLALGANVEAPDGSQSDKPYSVFLDVYAALSRFHMRRYGTTQRQIAAVAAKNHSHSVHNPFAQFRETYTVDEILAAPPITYPLTLPMCSPISDGAAAVVLMTQEGMRRHGVDGSRAVKLLATVLQTGADRDADQVDRHCTVMAGRKAYEMAGVGPQDISVAEVHDATATGEIIQTENLGLCRPGEGGPAAERGETSLGGRIPVNPSGGLESKGHPVAASGLAQIHELVTQLRGEAGPRQVAGARLALAENGGGLIGIEEAVACVTILGL